MLVSIDVMFVKRFDEFLHSTTSATKGKKENIFLNTRQQLCQLSEGTKDKF